MEKFKEGWHQLLYWCQHSENEKQLAALFDLLLTPEEKKDIAMRCLIVRELLAKKMNQREIAQQLNVSIAKITRGSNELKRMKPSIIQYVEDHLVKSGS